MIKTKRIKLTQKELFKILITKHLKKRWWVIAWLWGGALLMLMNNNYESLHYFFFGMSIIYPILMFWEHWRYVNSKDNKNLLLERHYEINTEKIIGIIDTETYSPVKLEYFIKAELIQNTYILYIARNQFIYIPLNSFEKESDIKWFDNEIIKRIKEQ